MSGHAIDKGVPVPKKKTGPNSKYPWPEMKPGDSVLFKEKNAVYAAHKYGRDNDKKFTSRKEGKKFRVWRVS